MGPIDYHNIYKELIYISLIGAVSPSRQSIWRVLYKHSKWPYSPFDAKVRRSVRPKVLQMGPHVKRVYDILTCVTTQVMAGYLTLPFVMLRFWPSIEVYK